MPAFHSVRGILLDIEGTTTPINFVYQTLFPYAARNMEAFLSKSFEESDRDVLFAEYNAETTPDLPLWTDPPVVYLQWLMAQDRKSRGLKSVQGKIWQAGYQSGELIGEVYPDVAPSLQKWESAGKLIGIFSSGSVQAQRLIFGHSTAGDLTSFISGYFDTSVGSKRESKSYLSIAAVLGIATANLLFISDISAELDAAKEARLQVCLSVRPGNPEQSWSGKSLQSFTELELT